MSTAACFLAAIFQGAEQGYAVLWRADTKQSLWLPIGDLGAADELAITCRETQGADLYCGVGLQAAAGGKHERGKESSVVAIPGAWCDLDLAEAAERKRAKKKYPPREVAEQALANLPLAPSAVVNSGGGMHCYWLFHEPLAIGTDAERAAAKQLTTGWQWLIAERLRQLGQYDLDSTADLTRVLRPAGSWNHKHGAAVELADGYADAAGWRRYDPQDLRQFVQEAPELLAAIERADYKVGRLDVSDSAKSPIEKVEALCLNSIEFRRVWEHKKTYPSNSERELALASYAVEALWSDQEIAGLLIWHRRRWEPEKLAKLTERQDYIARTISKARGDANRDLALRDLNGVGEPIGERKPQAPADDRAEPGDGKSNDRQATLDKLGAVLGVRIEKWIQFGRERPIYTLVLAGGRQIKIGGAAAVVENDRAFRQAIYIETGAVMARVKGKAWGGVCEALAAICEIIDAPDATDAVAVEAVIEEYLRVKHLYGADQRNTACTTGDAFVDDGSLYIGLHALRQWFGMRAPDRWPRGELLNAMRGLGFVSCHVAFVRSGKRTTRRYWKAPAVNFEDALPAADHEK